MGHGQGEVMMRTLVFFLIFALLLPAAAFADITGTKHDLTGVISGLTDPCRACHGGAHHWLPGAAGMGRWGNDAAVIYTSPTMDHQGTDYNLTTVNAIPSDVPLCLSCHDGAYVPPATNAAVNVTGFADLTSDLSDDHPVGFHFKENLDTGIKNPGTAKVNFGASGDMMWCSTCHNVHDDTNSPFLVMSNTGSALCLDCHIK